jgi:hypothetical protein
MLCSTYIVRHHRRHLLPDPGSTHQELRLCYSVTRIEAHSRNLLLGSPVLHMDQVL